MKQKSCEIYRYLKKALSYRNVAKRFEDLRCDPELMVHTNNVGFLAVNICLEAGFTRTETTDEAIASLLHDWGKLMVPSEILHRPGSLTGDEFEIVKKHPRYAFDNLTEIPLHTRKVIVGHHEFQKNAYPRKARRIPCDPVVDRLTQVLAVGDQAASMVSSRHYKPSYGRDKVFSEISSNFNGYPEYINMLGVVLPNVYFV